MLQHLLDPRGGRRLSKETERLTGNGIDEVRGGTGRSSSTIELFFDLVYVFAITQVVGLVHQDGTFPGLARGAFLLFLLWWTWSIYTWMTNWSGTDPVPIRLFLFAAMGTTLVMAIAVPEAFGDSSALFGASYFVVRLLAAGLYWYESKDYPAQRAAFMTFYPMSIASALLILIGGFTEGWALGYLFALGGLGDLISAVNAGRGTWAVDAAHFAERNGLFIIIALGESVVGLGLTAGGIDLDAAHIGALVVAFVGVAVLWWAYFGWTAPLIEHHFTTSTGRARGRFARDVYTFGHYPLVVGIVMFAVGLEDVVSHPDEPLSHVARVTLAAGTAIALGAMAATTYRAMRMVTGERLIAAIGLLVVLSMGATWTATLYAGVVVAIAVVAMVAERRPSLSKA